MTFVIQVTEPVSRDKAIGKWKTARTAFLVASGASFVAQLLECLGTISSPAMCALTAVVFAGSFAQYLYYDVRIKLALLAAELKKT